MQMQTLSNLIDRKNTKKKKPSSNSSQTFLWNSNSHNSLDKKCDENEYNFTMGLHMS